MPTSEDNRRITSTIPLGDQITRLMEIGGGGMGGLVAGKRPSDPPRGRNGIYLRISDSDFGSCRVHGTNRSL